MNSTHSPQQNLTYNTSLIKFFILTENTALFKPLLPPSHKKEAVFQGILLDKIAVSELAKKEEDSKEASFPHGLWYRQPPFLAFKM